MVKRISHNMKGYNMRGTYEAYILVEVKDGRQFVCALNRQKKVKGNSNHLVQREKENEWEQQVLWN